MLKHIKPDASKIPGFFEPNIDFKLNQEAELQQRRFQIVSDFLSYQDCQKLITLFNQSPIKESVSIQGLKDVESGVGSHRTTMWSEELANMLTQKLKKDGSFKLEYETNKFSRTDSWQEVNTDNNIWEFVGFSPLLRFMEYSKGGEHYSHYDAGYLYENSDYRTLKSVVIYLTSNESGFTRLIEDGQDNIEQSKRVNLDWSRETEKNEVYLNVRPIAGNMFIFDHRLCHDVSKFEPKSKYEKRIIIRGDLIFRRL